MITGREAAKISGGMIPGEYYMAQVVDRKDPDEKFRIKARIYPFWAGVEDAQLPWITPLDESAQRIKAIPLDWVWCIFKGDQLQPTWVCAMQTGAGGDYSTVHKQISTQLQAMGASSLSYPDFEIIKSDDILVVYNHKEGEIINVAGNSVTIMKKDGTTIVKGAKSNIEQTSSGDIKLSTEMGGGKVELSTAMGGKVEVSSGGGISLAGGVGQGISITPGLGGSVVLNNGTMGANDFPVCFFTGAPHCLDPLQSVKVP